MPAKNVLRYYTSGGIYHVYNRGVEKRLIFQDEQDYRMFRYYLFIYLAPLPKVLTRYPQLPIRLREHNLSREVELITYCLMPNHFHILARQQSEDGITKLLRQISNAYTRYFNQRYNRVGYLMQGVFKAAFIENELVMLHISRYIHLNPIAAELVTSLEEYHWSGYGEYLDPGNATLCHPHLITNYFSSPDGYLEFVKGSIAHRMAPSIQELYLEQEEH